MGTLSNSTTETGNNRTDFCHFPNWFMPAVKYMSFVSYDIGLPLHFILVTIPTCVIATAFCRIYIDERMYTYQRVLIVNMSLNSITGDLLTLTMRMLSGVSYKGVDWFMKNYYLMWYAGRLAAPLATSLNMVSVLLLISMAADRLLAIYKPMHYRRMNYKVCVSVTICLSYFFGLTSGLYDIPRYSILLTGTMYRLETNAAYVALPVVVFLNNWRNALTILSFVMLVSLNIVATIMLTKMRKVKVQQVSNEPQRDRDKRKLEQSLLIMSISQGFAMAVEKPLFVTFYILLYTDSKFLVCGNLLMSPVLDAYMKFCELAHITVLMTFNKPFSRMLSRFSCLKRFRIMSHMPTTLEQNK